MTRTGVGLALVVGGIVGVVLYLTAPVLVTLSALLGGIGVIDPGVATAFLVMVFGPWIVMAVVVIALLIAEVCDALARA